MGGSRHEFVDRENRIILEYKAKNSFHIEYIGMSGSNTFRFRVKNSFDEFVAGKTVYISTNNSITLSEAPAPAAPKSFFAQAMDFLDDLISVKAAYAAGSTITKVTDSRGEFTVTVTSPITQSITLTAQVGDSSASVTVDVTGSGLSIDTTSLPNGAVNVAYNQSISVSGGTSPYSFSATGLPGWLSLNNATGALTGTPTATGTFSFTIQVTDSATPAATASKQYTVEVGAAPVYGLALQGSPAFYVGSATAAVFVLTENGSPVADGTSVTLAYSTSSGAFTTNSDTASVGGGSGAFNLSLTGQTAGSVTITATWGGGKTADCTVTVAAATYVVSPVSPLPASIEAWESTTFTATITKNGSPVPDNETVTWTASGSGRFTSGTGSDTSRATNTNGGNATITLQGTAAGSVTVTASIGGANGQGDATFTAATYSISFTGTPSGAQTSSPTLEAKVVNSHGTAAEGVSVSWSYVNVNGGTSEFITPDTTTGAGGTTSKSIPYISGERRTVRVTAALASNSNINATASVQFGDALPSGFIAYAGESNTKDWSLPGTIVPIRVVSCLLSKTIPSQEAACPHPSSSGLPVDPTPTCWPAAVPVSSTTAATCPARTWLSACRRGCFVTRTVPDWQQQYYN